MKSLFNRLAGVAVVGVVLYSCASIGRPEGGAIDETPPRFVGSTPAPGALNNNRKKVTIEFDEFIKLEKPGEKIVISPPQVQQPEIKANGKKVVITLKDTSLMLFRTIMKVIRCPISGLLSPRVPLSTRWWFLVPC